MQAHVERAHNITPTSGVVILAYHDENGIHYEGADVREGVTNNSWEDCFAFPATSHAGWVEGKRLVVKPYTKWNVWTINGEKRERRLVLSDGKVQEETRDLAQTQLVP